MTQQSSEVLAYLQAFEEMAAKHPGPIPQSISFDFKEHSGHALFGAITHGNETGTLPGMLRVIRDLESGATTYGGKVSFMLGNVAACRQNTRFVEADLNRVFLTSAPASLEKDRALEMMSLIKSADLFIDFHQTIKASEEPFYIFPFDWPGYYWAKLLGGAKCWVTRAPGKSFAASSVCADEFARQEGIPGLTLEMGQMGLSPLAETVSKETIVRALHVIDSLQQGETLKQQAQGVEQELRFYEIVFAQPFAEAGMALKEGLNNFTPVQAEQVLGQDGKGGELLCPQEGVLLFPKYPPRDDEGSALQPRPKEIYNLATKMQIHPAEAFDLPEP